MERKMPKIKKEIKDWFPYPDDPYNGRVLVRLPKPGEQEAIKERSRELIVRTFRQTNEEMALRSTGSKEALAISSVSDWENFFDESDEPMKCTQANVKLMCKEAGFVDFIDECIAELEKRAAKKTEEEIKN
jgi:hypothetical protein